MKFDELKPGMVLYYTGLPAAPGHNIQVDWMAIRHKTDHKVLTDDYWEDIIGRRYIDYKLWTTKDAWDDLGNTYMYCQPANPVQARKLIVWLFEKSEGNK